SLRRARRATIPSWRQYPGSLTIRFLSWASFEPSVTSHGPGSIRLLLPEDQIESPTPSDMDTGLPAMVQNVGIIAAGVFEGIGENGKAVEGAVVVDGLTQGSDVRCTPGELEGDGVERVADDVS